MTAEGSSELGRFPVSADAASVATFCGATGRNNDGTVPLTFPMRWLTLPEVHDAVLPLLSQTDVVPVHESQSFEYREPLSLGRPYLMILAGRREFEPDRLVLDATISDEGGEETARLETILRLVSTKAAAA